LNQESTPRAGGQPAFLPLLFGLFVLLAAFGLWLATRSGEASEARFGADGTPEYLPLVRKDPPVPTPTPTPLPPVPQFVNNVPLPGVQCPNMVGYNAFSDYVYIANNFSSNVTVYQNRGLVANVAMDFWPTWVGADNDSPITYVTGLHGNTAVLNGTTKIGEIPDYYEPYGVIVNPANGYAYISDLDSTVQIANGTTLIDELHLESPPGQGAGWLRPIVVDPATGLVYTASWSHGKLYTLSGTDVIDVVQLGWGTIDMVIDSERGYLYAANEDPNATYPENISVYNLVTKEVTRISTDTRSRRVALDPVTGYAYFTHDESDTVTVLRGTEVIATIPVGDEPFGIAVNPVTGYVAVANQSSNDISILRNGAFVTTIPAQGIRPFAIGVDTVHNDFYVANRGDEYDLFQCRDASTTILH
jgi:YVTN family beta-propeller protein